MNRNYLLWLILIVTAVCAIVTAVVLFAPDDDERSGQGVVAVRTASEDPLSRRVGGETRLAEEQVALGSAPARRSVAEFEALYELAERDLAAGLAEAKRRYAVGRWKDVQAEMVSRLLEKDLSRAAEIYQQVDAVVMQLALQRVVPPLFRRDRARTTAIVFDQLNGRARDLAASYMVRAQLEDGDLLAAMQTHLRLPDSSQLTNSALEIAQKITSRDLGAALRWFEQMSSDDARKSAHGEMAWNLHKAGDAEGLMQLLAVTPPEEKEGVTPGGRRLWNRHSMISQIAGLCRQTGNHEALTKLRAMVPDEERDFVEVGLIYADQEKPLAERFTRATALTNLQARSEATSFVIGREVSKNPNQAAEFVLRLNEGSFQHWVGHLIAAWKSRDSQELATWVRSLPANSRRDEVIATAVMAYRHGHSGEKKLAREFAALASDPEQRERLAAQIPDVLSGMERAAGAR